MPKNEDQESCPSIIPSLRADSTDSLKRRETSLFFMGSVESARRLIIPASATTIQPFQEATEIQSGHVLSLQQHQSLMNNSPSIQPVLSAAAAYGLLAVMNSSVCPQSASNPLPPLSERVIKALKDKEYKT